MLKHETEENITEYLKQQGVTACKRFTIKKDGNLIETNTLLLKFNSICSVSTVRGLDIMRTAVLNPLDQSAKNVVWVILTTLHVLAKTNQNA